jgi:hypothetical protein
MHMRMTTPPVANLVAQPAVRVEPVAIELDAGLATDRRVSFLPSAPLDADYYLRNSPSTS